MASEDDGVITGADNIQTIDLADCKELQVPAPIQATLCRKGVNVILKDCPCKVLDLKISKTGKHGHAKANITGTDVITGKKIQETVPGHTTLMGFEPVKKEYEVANIEAGQITAIDGEGTEYSFNLPDNEEVGQKLLELFRKAQGEQSDQFFNISVVYAPRMIGKKWVANMLVESFKEGKEGK